MKQPHQDERGGVGEIDSGMDGQVSGSAEFDGATPLAQEIADLALFIASDRARYINGAKLNIDGGFSVNAR